MQEIELKFQIPPQALARLENEWRTLAGGERPAQRLQAAYFDTVDRKLAKARAALRVRQEDSDWVQTVKAAGVNAMTRLEDNQPVPPFGPGEDICPDLSRHVGDAVRQALMRDLGWVPASDPQGRNTRLTLLYRTDIRRLRAQRDNEALASSPARRGLVEMALDQGEIAAGGLREPVCEMEIELIDGDARAVLDVARDCVRRHGVWLDTQTKAHRGDQLAREALTEQPCAAPPARPRARVPAGAGAVERWIAELDAALEHICASQSEAAKRGASSSAGGQHPVVKAWASGLKRLRRAWRHAPAQATVYPELRQSVLHDAQAQLLALRPQPGHYAADEVAALVARSAAPTLLALDVLDVILIQSPGDRG